MLKRLFKIEKLYFFVFVTFLLLGSFFIFTPQANASIIFPGGGDLSGQVVDSQTSNVLSGVTLQLSDGFDIMGETVSDTSGNYYFFVPLCGFPGLEITATLDGYDTLVISGINVACSSTTVLDIELDPLEEEINPVILIPGIMGSWQVKDEWKIDPILMTYDNLIEAMLADDNYELNETFFTFAYDWRKSNVLTASLLKEKIDEVKQKTGSNKVDIVAHSMGGLVSRSYIQSSEYEDDVDQLIFLGVPHAGSPESYLAYEGAYISGGFSKLKKFYFKTQAIKDGYIFTSPSGDIVDLAGYIREQILSTGQLLPMYDYLEEEVNNNWQLRLYPVQYPQNTFLENLNTAPAINILKQRVDITNIYSSAGSDSTLSSIRVIPDPSIYDNKWMDGYPENLDENLDSLVTGTGDGTVPKSSLEFLSDVEILQFPDATHREVVTKAQQDIIEILTGTRPTEYHDGLWSTIKRMIFIRPYSPVDIAVVAPDGKIVGKDFVNNTEINQIEGAFYSGFEDEELEFVVIVNPLDGEYQVITEGTADGSYDIGVSYIEDNETRDSFVYDIPVTEEQEDTFQFNVDESSEEPFVIEKIEISIQSTIADIENLYNQGNITHKHDKKYLVSKLQRLSWQLKIYDKRISVFQKLIQKTEANNRLKAKVKEKLISKFNQQIDRVYKQRERMINRKLSHMQKKLDKMEKRNRIDEYGYGIITNDIDYLKINL